MKQLRFWIPGLLVLAINISCKKGVEQQKDELYSRHLQRNVRLEIINTPVPDDKSMLNLLIVNDARTAATAHLFETTDSLQKAGRIQPLVIVVVDGVNKKEEYGIAGTIKKAAAGSKADHYADFIHNELYPYAKKKAGVRKFKSVAIAGFDAGAVSALDIAWAHADKISKVGMFSLRFENKTGTDTMPGGLITEEVRVSRKRPKLEYWFYAGKNPGDTLVAHNTQALIEVLGSKSFVQPADIVMVMSHANTVADWAAQLPEFLLWSFGK